MFINNIQPRTIKKVSIPSIPDSEVELYNTLIWKDSEEIGNSDTPFISKGKEILVKLIKDWNLTDENGVKLPITTETIDMFTPDIVTFLFDESGFAPNKEEDSKKKIEKKD